MKKLLILAPLLVLSGCALPGMPSLAGAPPAQVQQASQIARAPIDLALNLFDGALYAFDLAMDLKRPAAGTPEAKRISAIGRKVLAALSVADAAQKAGSAATYEEAFRNAALAYAEFSKLLGVPSTDLASSVERIGKPFTEQDRVAVLARADTDGAAVALVLGKGA
jgi:hypothetical protein